MDATSTQGALCHLAPHSLRLCTSVCAQACTCTPWGKGCRFSGFLEGSWEHGRGSGLCHHAPDKCKGQCSRPLACLRCPSHRSEPAVEEQSRRRSPGGAPAGCGARWGRRLRGSARNGSAYPRPGIRRALPCPPESLQGRHRVGDITGAGAPSISAVPYSSQSKSALEAEGQQPPARSPPPRQSLLRQHGGDRWEPAGRAAGRGGESESEGAGRGDAELARGPGA